MDSFKKSIKKESKNKNEDKDQVAIDNILELERKERKDMERQGYDFVPRIDHWTSLDEQKLKVEEIEKKTK